MSLVLNVGGIVKQSLKLGSFTLLCFFFSELTHAAFVHPGCLSTQADLNRMAAKVAAKEQPWKGSWDILVGNHWFYYNQGPEAVPTVCVDSGTCGSNYMNLARDSHRAYQCALRYHGSGDTAYADKAVQIMNAWASAHTSWNGNSNVSLRQGLYGYAFACAAELMRDYSGWQASDFAAFQQYMINQFYAGNSWFLNNLYGRCESHYWANWTLANMASMLAIGVLCDNQAIFDEALNHFFNGVHTGAIENAVYYVHPDGLGQWQESGRDQGHCLIGPQLIGVFCEIAWNQGIDLYGVMNNRVLAGVEYISKYNTWHEVPFVTYMTCDYATWPEPYRFAQTAVAPGGRGQIRPGWDMIYNHYVNRMGMAAPWTGKYAEMVRPEGGGINYGTTSGGFDGLGFTTLTHSRDPIASGAVPSVLRPFVEGRQITLSWAGSAYAQSYNVKRSVTSGGPYTTLAIVGPENLFYIDSGLTVNTTYYYVVSANHPDGESANSVEVAATADGRLRGTLIGTDGSYGGFLAEKICVFDGSLKNFFDGPESVSWAGLDLGQGVSTVITQVKYCPRPGFANRMVGGKFQGSNTADFSSGVTTLYTISKAPAYGVLTSQNVSNPAAFRYVRYLGPSGGYCNTAEVQFFGTVSGLSIPTAPAGVNARVLEGYKVHLTWEGVPSATCYTIKRAAASGGPYVVVDHTMDASYTDIDLAGGTTYYYVVSSLNNAGHSADSDEVSATTQPSSPILTAYYKFDGDLTDSSGFGYHAAAMGAPSYGAGYSGPAIILDGVDDLVILPKGIADYDDITVAAWVYWNGGGDWQRIFDFGNNTSQYFFLTPKSGGGNTLRFAIKNSGPEQIVETSQLAENEWVHVAVTLAGNTATLYVNGTVADTNTAVTINPSDFCPALNYIGDSQWSADPLFNGCIDEFRIYNYALSALQIDRIRFEITQSRPWGGVPAKIPGRIEFEDYDIGGQFISFYDRTDTNGYRQYRPDEPVDIMAVNDGGAAYAVYADAGEWLEYTCDIQAGTYTLIIRSAGMYGPQQGILSLNGQTAATVTLPTTDGWTTWASTEVPDIYLTGGPGQILRFTLNTSTAALNFMEFVRQYNPADITQDGQVNLADFATLAAQWLSAPAVPSADIAPPERDGMVDISDFIFLIENWLAME
jgi:hypothetical protein